jgi:hypothetical protein
MPLLMHGWTRLQSLLEQILDLKRQACGHSQRTKKDDVTSAPGSAFYDKLLSC